MYKHQHGGWDLGSVDRQPQYGAAHIQSADELEPGMVVEHHSAAHETKCLIGIVALHATLRPHVAMIEAGTGSLDDLTMPGRPGSMVVQRTWPDGSRTIHDMTFAAVGLEPHQDGSWNDKYYLQWPQSSDQAAD